MVRVTFILISFLLGSWSSLNEKNNYPKRTPAGIWTEKWIGAGTDVNYVDTLMIRLNKSDWTIIATNDKDLAYDSISFGGNNFNFRMQNTTHQKEKFYVYYTLQLNNSGNLLEGTIINSNKQTDTVRLEKIRGL